MARQKVIKDKPGIQKEETKNFTESILNDPKIFDPVSFKTIKIDDKNMVVYGKKKVDNKVIIHKIMTRK